MITIWEAIQKKSHELIYKTYTKIEAKGLRATTLLIRAITKWGAIENWIYGNCYHLEPFWWIIIIYVFTVAENIIATTKIRNNYHSIIHFYNIGIAILDFSLLLLVKLSILIPFASFLVSVFFFFFFGSLSLKLSLFQLSR